MITAILLAVGFISWATILHRWQTGLPLLVLYLPFAGAIILLTQGDIGTVLAKDLLFVLPLYISFFLRGFSLAEVRIPPLLTVFILSLATIVILQMANPAIPNPAVAMVGAKVWLFYIPLLVVTMAALRSEREFVQLLRAMVALAPIPCVVGLGQFFGSNTIGHEETITAFYGDAAAGATQGFTAFDYGGHLYRLPSTFVSVAHYFGYVEHSLVPAYAVLRCDPSRAWRRYALVIMLLLMAAGLLSGARSAFVFLPALLVLILVFDRVLVGAVMWAVVTPTLIVLVLGLAGLDPVLVFTRVNELGQGYAKGLVIGSVRAAIELYPLGIGTGMNTNAARHVLAASSRSLVGFESQYAKTVTELGVIGLVALLGVFASMISGAWRSMRLTVGSRWRSTAAGLAAYFVLLPIHSLKGWPLDWEPANVYYWMFGAMSLALPRLAAGPARHAPQATLRGLWQQQRAARGGAAAAAPRPRLPRF